MTQAALILLVAVGLDFWLGDPRYRCHPVRLIGNWIAVLERWLRLHGRATYLGGGVLFIVSCLLPLTVTALVFALLNPIPGAGVLFAIFAVYSCLGLGDLRAHARPIAKALKTDNLKLARERVSWIVGRDVTQLDGPGVARATVESVAENFVDAFLAPVFWYVVGSVIGAATAFEPFTVASLAVILYRIINTLDAMVGYRNDKYLLLGCVSAKCDDAANFIPARCSIPLLVLAAQFCGFDARNALRAGMSDRLKHPSPNSAHAESAVAGALGIALGGPTPYRHGLIEKEWLNSSGLTASATDIERSSKLITVAAGLSVALFVLTEILFW